MLKLEQTDVYRADSAEEAKTMIEKAKEEADASGYSLKSVGYNYKNKKSKGEIIDEAWVVKIVKTFQGVWE